MMPRPVIPNLLAAAVQSFQLASANQTPLLNAIVGVRSILLLCNSDERPSSPEEIVTLLDTLIELSAPCVALEAAPAIESEEVYLGLAAAASLLREILLQPAEGVELTQSCLDHAALLASELDAIYRRREIERRGDVLRRYITKRRFENASSFGQSLH